MAGQGEARTSPRRLAAAERQRQALLLRRGGASYDQIAQRLGYRDRASAYRAVLAALEQTLREPAEEVRALELERLDALLLAHWPAATSGNVEATDRVLRIMERRARLLGLDAPRQLNVRLTLHEVVEQVARETGLSYAEALAEAERILAGSGA